MSHAGGRPTEYSDKVLKNAKQYLKDCEDEEIQQTIGLSVKGTELYKNKLTVNLPTIEGLAVYLKVNRDTLYEWSKHYKEFSDTLEDIKAEQAKRLIDKGLSGDYNPTIAKLILSANHGMREKADITTNGKDLPQPIMKLDVLNNDSDKENNNTEEKDQSSARGNISKQDNLDSNILDSLSPERQG